MELLPDPSHRLVRRQTVEHCQRGERRPGPAHATPAGHLHPLAAQGPAVRLPQCVERIAGVERDPEVRPAQSPMLRAQVAATPDATLAEHRDRWAADQGVHMSVSGLHRALVRLEITRKQRHSGPASRIR